MPENPRESARISEQIGEKHKHSDEEELPAKVEVTGEQEKEETTSALDEAVRKAEEYLNLLQRTQADFINYKRRVEQERQEQRKFAAADVIAKLLPTLDDLQRALRAVPAELKDTDWVKGIELIERKLNTMLAAEGVSRIEAEGKEFSPWEHEAISYVETSDHDEGKVQAIVREGYKLHDRVLRPAQVIVTKRGDE